MKRKSFWQIILLNIIAISSLALVGCQDEDEIQVFNNQVTDGEEFSYSYTMTLLPEEGEATRATSYDWKDGDVLYLVFHTSDDKSIFGRATYNATSDKWDIKTNSAIKDSQNNCGIFYFDNCPSDSIKSQEDHWIARTNQYSLVYFSTYRNYYKVDENLIVHTNLQIYCDRIRFQGKPGTKISFKSEYAEQQYSWHQEFYMNWNNFYCHASDKYFEDLTVQQDGYTPYVNIIYHNTNDTTAILTIQIDNENIYARRSTQSRSKTFLLPDTQSDNGWGIMQTVDDITYLFDSRKKTAVPYRYLNETATEVNIPSSVYHKRIDYQITELGERLFENHQYITKVTIPEGVSTIGNFCFASCPSLTAVALPGTIKRIGSESFRGCHNLTNINLPEGLVSIGWYSFGHTKIKSIQFPSTVSIIGGAAFWYAEVEEVSFSKGLYQIGSQAFYGSRIKRLELPEGTRRLEGECFKNCQFLESVSIPTSISYIGNNLFAECPNLSSIEIKSPQLPQAEAEAFQDNYSNVTLYVPSSAIDKYKAVDPWKNFSNIRAIAGTESDKISVGNTIDLGLPSGTLWADRNVGASYIESRGDFFAWGETTAKSIFGDDYYKFYNSATGKYTKYVTDAQCGNVDNLNELQSEDDAAVANWGNGWRTPTREEARELINNCTWSFTTYHGVYGYLVTGPNGNSIFMPECGLDPNHYAHYLTTSGENTSIEYLDFYEQNHYMAGTRRCYEALVRPVKSK